MGREIPRPRVSIADQKPSRHNALTQSIGDVHAQHQSTKETSKAVI